MVGSLRCAARCGLTCGVLVTASAVGARAAEDTAVRNLMLLDGDNHRYVQFIDTDSIRRSGDQLEFDTVGVGYSYSIKLKTLKPGESANIYDPANTSERTVKLDGRVTHLRISCGWRTVARPDQTIATLGNDQPKGAPTPDSEFIEPTARYIGVIDRLCRGETLAADGSLRSLKAGLTKAETLLDPPAAGFPSPSPATPDPAEPDWVAAAHDFAPVMLEPLQAALPADERGLMFIDRKALTRNGDRAESVTLMMMGSRALRFTSEGDDTVVMRRAAYDCAKGSLQVLSEARWNRYGILTAVVEKPSPPRGRSESPIIAAEIAAVCAGGPPAAKPSLASLDDAWAVARKDWPAPTPRPYRLDCVYQALPGDWRAQLLAHWAERGLDSAPLPQGAVEAAFAACNVAEADRKAAADAMGYYIPEQASLAWLKAQGFKESAIVAAVDDGLTWRQKQRLKKSITASSQADREFEVAMVNVLVRRLGINNRAAADQLYMYLMTHMALMPV